MEIPITEVPCRKCGGSGSRFVPDVAAMVAGRERAGLTQSELARRAEWQSNYVSQLESGSRPPTRAAAERYMQALAEKVRP